MGPWYQTLAAHNLLSIRQSELGAGIKAAGWLAGWLAGTGWLLKLHGWAAFPCAFRGPALAINLVNSWLHRSTHLGGWSRS